MNKKAATVLNLVGWVFVILAVRRFLGLGVKAEETYEVLGSTLLGELLPIPDFKTILLAGAAILCGFLARDASSAVGEIVKKGTKVMVCGVLCIVLTFTPLSKISVFTALFNAQGEQLSSDGREAVPEGKYSVRAFLGSDKSYPADVDILRYTSGYDGHAEDTYKNYKICGWLINESGEAMREVSIRFVLVDADGNDILVKGEPVVLTTVDNSKVTQLKNVTNRPFPFETNVVKAKDLPVTPYGYRVECVERAYFIDVFDGTKSYNIIT